MAQYRFKDFALPKQIRLRLEATFAPLEPIEVVAKRVERATGAPVAVRILAVSFKIPKGITFPQVASEIGRDFLRASPANSSKALGGRGIYMKPLTAGGSEAMAFFIGKEIFVYAYGASSSSPTESVAKQILRHSDLN